MLRAVAAACVTFAACSTAYASPPLKGSEDYDQLMPYSEWIAGRVSNKGGLCCSISDCRVVSWRTKGSAYEAFIATRDDRGFTKFPGAPDAWVTVPTDVIKRDINPTGRAIACWSANHPSDFGYYCFFLPDLS